MMKRTIATFLSMMVALTLAAQPYRSEIASQEGEKWYGVYTAKAFNGTPLEKIRFQPYPADYAPKDLRIDNNSNQAAPLLLSNMGRYIWSDEPFVFELQHGDVIIRSDTEQIAAVEAGSTLRDAYLAAMQAHFPPQGRTPDPLMFRMPQYNTWIELNYNQNQADVLRYADAVIENGFPVGVFMIDDQWTRYYGDLDFDPGKFPDPKAMVDELHAKGFKVMVWVSPFVSADTPEYRTLRSQKALVMRRDGKGPALVRWWNGYSACIDFTQPAAVAWYQSKLDHLQTAYGIDGFKFDAADFDFYTAGSPVFPNENTTTTGPVQAELYAQFGARYPFNEFRASWKNGNLAVAQRLQDKAYSWDDMQLLIPDMVSAGLIGHHFTCPDMIGGGLLGTFDNDRFDGEMMVRSAQIQALMPMMQFSVAPWRVLDAEHLALCRAAARLHAALGDEIYAMACEAARTGEPIIRHLEYAFPHEGFEACNDMYMFGNKYLVAPMTTSGTSREITLPRGRWRDETGKMYRGGRTYTVDIPLDRLPYFELVSR